MRDICITVSSGSCSVLTVLLAATTRKEPQCYIQAWNDLLRQLGLHLNIKTTEYVETNLSTSAIQVSGKDLVKTKSFCYLESHLQNDSSIKEIVHMRVNATWLQ